MLAILAVATGALDDIGWGDVPPFVGIGVLGFLSYVSFYKALEIGPISIVSPIVSGYAAVSLILAVLILGETLTGGQIAAVVLVMLGVVLASSDLGQIDRIERRQALGLALALVTFVAIGAFVFGNAYYMADFGWLAPIFLSRGFTMVVLLLASLREGGPGLVDRSPSLLGLLVVLAVVDTAGYAAFNIGTERAETSVVSGASAPYAVVPIVVGLVALEERPAPIQWFGIAAVVGGVVLLGLTS